MVAGFATLITLGTFVLFGQGPSAKDHWNKQGLKPNWSNRFFAPSTNSQMRFTIDHNGTQVVGGQFGSFSNNIFYFDDSGELFVKFNISSSSVTVGNQVVDSILQAKNWLDTKSHPQISFSSKNSVKTSQGYKVMGDLTLKGQTREVSLNLKPINVKTAENHMRYFAFDGDITFNRGDFKITGQRDWYPSPWKVNLGNLNNQSKMTLSMYFVAQSWGQQWGSDVFHRSSGDANPVGLIYDVVRKNGYKKGIKEYERIKKEMPDKVDENTLGYVAFILTLDGKPSEKEFESAYKLFEYNIKQFPDYVISQKNYAETLAMGGNIDAAQDWFMKVKEKDESLLEAEFFGFYGIR